MSKSIKEILKNAPKKQIDIIDTISEGLRVTRTVGPINKDDKIWFRASKMFDLCPVEEVFYYQENKSREETIESGTSVIFAMGNAIHSAIQNAVKTSMIGFWRCDKCKKIWGWDSVKKIQVNIESPEDEKIIESIESVYSYLCGCPVVCPSCGHDDFVYVEPYFCNSAIRIGGHMDGIWYSKEFILEIKSTNGFQYSKMSKSGLSNGYIWQANIYMALTKIPLVRAVLVNKEKPSEMTNINVHYNKEIVYQVKNKCNAVGAAVVNDRELILENHRICANRHDVRAAKCMFCDRCFSLKVI
jgi:hypothetical protein